ncbi:MAG: D-alanyl-D-alanine carboxypeptidase/D-alanyl-D-alanine-endopeptidase [Candidatus Gastranaerophilaceae bacterium]
MLRLEDAIRSEKMDYYGKFSQKKTPDTNIYLVSEISHPVEPAIEQILKNSNNFVAETVFKIAGGQFVKNTGSLENSLKMLNAYFEKIGLNAEDIKIVDGSGVSKNNIITADFMSEFLVKKTDCENFVNSLPTSGEGTLKSRMLYFKDNLRAKTGTLADVSAIAGYITSRSGKTYAFDIMINDPKSKITDKKSLEEYILRDIYTSY